MKKILAYWLYVIIFFFGLTPLLWFWGKGDILINGVDTNFPLDPEVWFSRRFYVWNNIVNAGSNFSSSTAGLFFHFIQFVPYKLGFDLQQVQIISLIFWFSLIVFSAFWLVRIIFPKKTLVQLLFVVLYSFNIYLFNSWENVKVANLSLIAGIPLSLSVLILRYQNQINYVWTIFLSALSGIILSGTGINPAYFLSLLLLLALFFIGGLTADWRWQVLVNRIKDTLLVSTVIITVNLFWILPTIKFIAMEVPSSGSIDKIGFTNWVDGLSENTSLLNVLRLQGIWDWYAVDFLNQPLYIPYASKYLFGFLYQVFSFLIPFLAIFSFVIYDQKKKFFYLTFGLMLITGVFLGAGTHPPTGVLFRWFSDHLPFFSLLRSPWYIFTPLTVLAFAGLVSLLTYNLDEKIDHSNFKGGKYVFSLLILLLVGANLFYARPLIQGEIFRPGRSDGFYIKFPPYIFEAQKWLRRDQEGRIINFPDNNMEVFDWGYRGIDSILGLLVDRETLFMPFHNDDSPISRLIKELSLSLKKGELESAKSITGKLNVSLILEKQDQWGWPEELPISTGNFSPQIFDKWHFLSLPDDEYVPKVFSPDRLFLAYPYNASENMLSVFKGKGALLNSEDSVINALPNINGTSGKIILAENSQAQGLLKFEIESGLENRLKTRDLSQAIFIFKIPADGIYQPLLQRYRLEDFGIDLKKNPEVEVDGKSTVWEINNLSDSFVSFAPVTILKGEHKVVFKLTNNNLVAGGSFDRGINFTRGGDGRDVGVYEIVESGEERFLSMLNTSIADVTADWQISPFDPLADYYVEVKYKQIYGDNALLSVAQTGGIINRNQLEQLPNYPEWRVFSFYYRPSRAKSNLIVKVMASMVHDPLGTKVFYDDLKVQKVFSNKLLFVSSGEGTFTSAAKIDFKKISPVSYEGEVRDGDKPHVIIFSENYSPEWELTAYNMEGVKLDFNPPHFSANLYANGWYLENTPQVYKFKIYYKPQKLFLGGVGIFAILLILSVSAVMFLEIKKRLER